jgi:hypothetical protein
MIGLGYVVSGLAYPVSALTIMFSRLRGSSKPMASSQTHESSTASCAQAPGPTRQGDPHARQRPQLRGYLVLIAVYNGIVALVLLIAKRSGRLGPRPRVEDLLLAGLAVQRLSRLITKDRVTSAIRAPFTAYEGEAGPGEVEERARGRGLRKALGELLVCPFCIAQWLAAAFMCGLLFAPRATRWLAGMFGVVALADTLQLLYKRVEDLATKG